MKATHPIGIFDSGYGGLTVFREVQQLLPQYDYLYLGDNARTPYGNRSTEAIHAFTWQCVSWLFRQGCPLVILACNTASARALRIIQQQHLPVTYPEKRVLGVIRPSAEVIGHYTISGHIGILGTKGTIASGTYREEIKQFFPGITVHQQACPMWVPLVEHFEYDQEGADYFIEKYITALLEQAPQTDTVLLACTHYPLLITKIRQHLPAHINIIAQGGIVAAGLKDYLYRHPQMEVVLSRHGSMDFYTTDDPEDFGVHASAFFGSPLQARHLHLDGW